MSTQDVQMEMVSPLKNVQIAPAIVHVFDGTGDVNGPFGNTSFKQPRYLSHGKKRELFVSNFQDGIYVVDLENCKVTHVNGTEGPGRLLWGVSYDYKRSSIIASDARKGTKRHYVLNIANTGRITMISDGFYFPRGVAVNSDGFRVVADNVGIYELPDMGEKKSSSKWFSRTPSKKLLANIVASDMCFTTKDQLIVATVTATKSTIQAVALNGALEETLLTLGGKKHIALSYASKRQVLYAVVQNTDEVYCIHMATKAVLRIKLPENFKTLTAIVTFGNNVYLFSGSTLLQFGQDPIVAALMQ
eukprot:CAMPEP_0168525048 /NCGR_PEP_ID=MMETSP0405-20121227/11060_1 /TAXON_ID=498012 /ORGANISM="Trichosphaerium sp, Strain Am-I-7 wt" /LENGTH=302 /DNA_ID=CAMNT_0008547465 /DNA_START=114 /DNA_END=1022 /DNA_ORIENTATION=-